MDRSPLALYGNYHHALHYLGFSKNPKWHETNCGQIERRTLPDAFRVHARILAISNEVSSDH